MKARASQLLKFVKEFPQPEEIPWVIINWKRN